jgi:hypothetical protein
MYRYNSWITEAGSVLGNAHFFVFGNVVAASPFKISSEDVHGVEGKNLRLMMFDF